MATLTADVQNLVLTAVVDGYICDVERAQMQLEDQRAHAFRATAQLVEEVSYIQSRLYNSGGGADDADIFLAARDALKILDPRHRGRT